MGFTLDELLNETGVNNLGARHTKTAAPAKPDFSKLAARCRRAAEASPADQVAAGNATLAEKVASVEIIRRTMAEIAAIDGGQTKTAAPAAPVVDTAAFIKVALEAGHSPEAIAEFLEKAAAPGGIRRFFGEIGSSLRSSRAGSTVDKAKQHAESALRSWKSSARAYDGLGDIEKMKFVEKLRKKYPDATVHAILGDNKGFAHLPAMKELRQAVTPAASAASGGAAGGKALGVNIGGTQLGVTNDQLKKMKKPALYLGGGALAYRAINGGKSEPEKKKSGVVIVNG